MKSRFVVKESQAKAPSTAWGRYINVAVMEVEADFVGEPSMISPRAKGVVRIVARWDRCYLGKERSAGATARKEAAELCRTLNCPLERIARL